MADVMVTWFPPTTRTDGSPFGTSMLGGGNTECSGANIFRDGVKIAEIRTVTFIHYDRNVPPGTYLYEVSILDKQVPPAEGPRGRPVLPTVVSSPTDERLAPPAAPAVITNVQ